MGENKILRVFPHEEVPIGKGLVRCMFATSEGINWCKYTTCTHYKPHHPKRMTQRRNCSDNTVKCAQTDLYKYCKEVD